VKLALAERFAVLDELLLQRLEPRRESATEIACAGSRLLCSGGACQ